MPFCHLAGFWSGSELWLSQNRADESRTGFYCQAAEGEPKALAHLTRRRSLGRGVLEKNVGIELKGISVDECRFLQAFQQHRGQ